LALLTNSSSKKATKEIKYRIRNNLEKATKFLANKEKYHNETIPHEVAHLFQNVLYPKDSTHGIGWQKLMRLVGLSPKRCHNYDITVAVVTFKYICACRKHEVSKVIHNKMVRGQRRICCKCRSTLVKL